MLFNNKLINNNNFVGRYNGTSFVLSHYQEVNTNLMRKSQNYVTVTSKHLKYQLLLFINLLLNNITNRHIGIVKCTEINS
jgi:hypothetical protein